MRGVALSLATAVLLTGCASVGLSRGTPTGANGASALSASEPTLDLAAYERLTTTALKEAIAANDQRSIAQFVAYADGPDPQPASSRRIAQAALDNQANAQAVGLADLTRIAAGRAKTLTVPRQAPTGIEFPTDEGDHPTALTEWWYLNGHLEGRGIGPFKGRYGYEFTLFKAGALLHWAHVALTDVRGKQFRYERQWIPSKQAVAAKDKLDVQYGENGLHAQPDGTFTLTMLVEGQRVTLNLAAKKAPLLINGNGKIDMPEGKDSWYYSKTRLETKGTVGNARGTSPVTGVSWMDHQWGPFIVSGFQDRWDWFALQFDDGTEYNLFGFRDRNGNAGARHVNRSGPDGRGTVGSQGFTLDRKAWWQSPASKLHYTTSWLITLPETAETVEVTAEMAEQEVLRKVSFWNDPLPSYWEGTMKAKKRGASGKPVEGVAYCEHFGFKQPTGPR